MKTNLGLLAFALFCLLSLVSCSPQYTLHSKSITDTLYFNLKFARHIAPSVQEQIVKESDLFVKKFNSERHTYALVKTDAPRSTQSLTLTLQQIQLVSKPQQTTGAIVSVLGLSFPFLMVAAEAPFYLFFYYFPRVKSQVDVQLTDDLRKTKESSTSHIVTSPGFLKSVDRQLFVYSDQFDQYFLKSIFTSFDNNQKVMEKAKK